MGLDKRSRIFPKHILQLIKFYYEQVCSNIGVGSRTLHSSESLRFFELIDKDLAQKLLCQENICIAGGAIVYSCVCSVHKKAVGDIDVWVLENNTEKFWEYARLINSFFANNGLLRIERQVASVKFVSKNFNILPIQLILCPGNIEDLIYSFDLDYVQCAISFSRSEKVFKIHRTFFAQQAHESKQIRYILDFKYNPLRLYSRLKKAGFKGFSLPSGIVILEQLGIDFYIPIHVKENGGAFIETWKTEELDRKIDMNENIDEAIEYYELRNQDSPEFQIVLPHHTKFFKSLDDAANSMPLEPFSRSKYDGDNNKHVREFEGFYTFFKVPSYIYLTHLKREGYEPNIRRVAWELYDPTIQRIRARLRILQRTSNSNQRHFYWARALQLILDKKYGEAILSAQNDFCKLKPNGDKMYLFLLMLEHQNRIESGHNITLETYDAVMRIFDP
jgi:hypothetical protein